MRNRRSAGMWVVGSMLAVVSAQGCATTEGIDTTADARQAGARSGADAAPKPLRRNEVQTTLTAAYAAFERKQLDQAMAGADRVLVGNPAGPGAAEAHYLRGRVLEERATQAANKGDITSAKASLQAARDAYNSALNAKPAPNVEGNTRAGIANVAYFQEDYTTAITQWTAANDKIAEPQTKAWVLYRVGLSQQRSGRFLDADRTFAAVQQQFPGTEPARRAAAHQGARGFHVQVGVFGAPANADGTLTDLRKEGVIGLIVADSAGRHIVRVGPVPTYEQAKVLKSRLAGKYPDSIIIP